MTEEIRKIKTHIDINGSVKFVLEKQVLKVTFYRTLRIPDDGNSYTLPAAIGSFPVKKVSDYADRVPASWREHGGVFIPLWQREAMWLSFSSSQSQPWALKVAAGKINAITGEPWEDNKVHNSPEQDYVVAPPQPWLDGFNVKDGKVRQFVAMPLGMGYTVEGQVSGKEEFGGLQLQVVPPTKEWLENNKPEHSFLRSQSMGVSYMEPSSIVLNERSVHDGEPIACAGAAEMGLAQGGMMDQKIYPDPHGIEIWDQSVEGGRLFVHMVNSQMYEQITGEKTPESPITKETYKKHGFKWYSLLDEKASTVKGSDKLSGVKSVSQMDEKHGFKKQMDNESIEVKEQVKMKIDIPEDKTLVKDGSW